MERIDETLRRFFTYYVVPQRLVFCYFGYLAVINAYTLRLTLDYAQNVKFLEQPSAWKRQNCANRLQGGCDYCHRCAPPRPPPATKSIMPSQATIAEVLRHLLGENLSKRSIYLNPEHNAMCAGSRIAPQPANSCSTPTPISVTASTTWMWRLAIMMLFYASYILVQSHSSQWARQYDRKWVLGIGLLSSAICTLFMPFAIRIGGGLAYTLFGTAIFAGAGTTFPMIREMMAQWVPSKERGQLAQYVLWLGQFSIIACNMLANFIMQYYEQWSAVSYFFGFGALLWFIGYSYTCSSGPDTNTYIAPAERDYIIGEIGEAADNPVNADAPNASYQTPTHHSWLSRLPFAAMLYSTIQSNWEPLIFAYEFYDLINNNAKNSFKQTLYALLSLITSKIFEWINNYGLESAKDWDVRLQGGESQLQASKMVSSIAAMTVSLLVSGAVQLFDATT